MSGLGIFPRKMQDHLIDMVLSKEAAPDERELRNKLTRMLLVRPVDLIYASFMHLRMKDDTTLLVEELRLQDRKVEAIPPKEIATIATFILINAIGRKAAALASLIYGGISLLLFLIGIALNEVWLVKTAEVLLVLTVIIMLPIYARIYKDGGGS